MSKTEKREEQIVIKAPCFDVVELRIKGTAPYVQNKFPQKAIDTMRAKHEAGSVSRKGAKREPKDFQACYEGAKHVSREGWCGIPAAGFRAGAISACRLVGFKMTHAKLSLFVLPDGFDAEDGTPLVRITKGKPHYVEHAVRISLGTTDIRARPMWDEGWEALMRVRFDADQFTAADVANLFLRVGAQVGIGEGRPDSKMSAGMGWGTFEIAGPKKQAKGGAI